MRITLLFTPNRINPNFKGLEIRDDNLGFVPPLSLLYVAAIMEKEGVEVDLIDMEAERLTYDQALARISRFSPDLLGFTANTSSFHPVLTWIRRFKADTGLPILVGGEHIKLYPRETMTHPEFDFCIVGEAEVPLPQFLRAFRDKTGFHGIKSLCWRDGDQVVIDSTLQTVPDIDEVPWPARHLIDNTLYQNILSNKKNFTAMVSTRGCPFRCAFCTQNLQPYRVRSPKGFVDEIEDNLKRHDIREFDIYDSTFTASKKRVFGICEEIQRRGLDVSFTVRSRVDVVTEDMVKALKRAGCHTIMYGIESSNPDILKKMNKGISPERVEEVVRLTKRAGLDILGFFMFGFPGESRQTIEHTIEYSLRLPLDYAQYTVLAPFPETEIYAHYRAGGMADYWAEYTLDPSKERPIELMDTFLTRDEATSYLVGAYKRFYFRPRIIMNKFKKIRSFAEFKRLTKGALGILSSSSKGSDLTQH